MSVQTKAGVPTAAHLLVVDDEPEICSVLSEYFGAQGTGSRPRSMRRRRASASPIRYRAS
jgi:CheY-like chemotaxis protein